MKCRHNEVVEQESSGLLYSMEYFTHPIQQVSTLTDMLPAPVLGTLLDIVFTGWNFDV